MPLGSFRLNGLSKKKGALARTASTFSGTRSGTTTGQFSDALNQSSTATLNLPSGIKIGNGSAGTIEFWFRLNSIINQVQFAGTSDDGVQVMCNTGNGPQVRIANSEFGAEYKNEFSVSTNTWYHLAITTSGNGTWNHYVNGTKRSQAAGWNFEGEITSFGFGSNGGIVRYDEIRFSNNIRYTASFSVETAPFANDVNTLALFHCESTGETDDIS